MNPEGIPPNTDEAVNKLLEEYKAYLHLEKVLEEERGKELTVLRSLTTKGAALEEVIQHAARYPTYVEIREARKTIEKRRQEIADRMTFASPLIWLRYKCEAYRDTAHALENWGALKSHCTPVGYICTKRFHFLAKVVLEKHDLNIREETTFPPDMPLSHICEHEYILAITQDEETLTKWQMYEYFQVNGKTAKWKNYSMG